MDTDPSNKGYKCYLRFIGVDTVTVQGKGRHIPGHSVLILGSGSVQLYIGGGREFILIIHVQSYHLFIDNRVEAQSYIYARTQSREVPTQACDPAMGFAVHLTVNKSLYIKYIKYNKSWFPASKAQRPYRSLLSRYYASSAVASIPA